MNTHDTSRLLIGTASSGLQIEGGEVASNWHDFAKQPGRIKDGSTPKRATDHWNRWREDNALMSELGLQIARLSVEWSRIEPECGQFDQAVLARYREEIRDLTDRGIRPLVTLHHFTHPRWLEELGGFTNPEAVEHFLRYTAEVVAQLGDLVTDWVTVNEPNVYATGAHLFGQFPPATKSWSKLRATLRHLAQAHCLAYALIHDMQDGQARPISVTFAHHVRVFAPLNPKNLWHRVLSHYGQLYFQGVIEKAMFSGIFPRFLGSPGPVQPGRYADAIALNYYSRTAISRLDDGTFPGAPVNDLGWEIYPDGLVECARALHERYGLPIWVSENGTCDNGGQGQLERFRPRLILEHLRAITESGLPFERYYHWCFVDNWEWDEGEVPRFGIVYLDYETQERTVKPSGYMLRDVIAAGGITEEIWNTYAASQSYPRNQPAAAKRSNREVAPE